MTDNQYYAKKWLQRMWNKAEEVKEYEQQAEEILGAKIPAYDAEKIPGGSDLNPTETKNIEYSTLMFEIEKKRNELHYENTRTFNIIQHLTDPKLRGILYAKYVNRKTIRKIAEDFHYAESSIKEFHLKALEQIYPYIPREVIEDGKEDF